MRRGANRPGTPGRKESRLRGRNCAGESCKEPERSKSSDGTERRTSTASEALAAMSAPEALAPAQVPAALPTEAVGGEPGRSVLFDVPAEQLAVEAGLSAAAAVGWHDMTVRSGVEGRMFRTLVLGRVTFALDRRPRLTRPPALCYSQEANAELGPVSAAQAALFESSLPLPSAPLDVPRTAGLPPLGSSAFHPRTPAMIGSAPAGPGQPSSFGASLGSMGTPPLGSSPRVTGSLRAASVGVSKKPSRASNSVRFYAGGRR